MKKNRTMAMRGLDNTQAIHLSEGADTTLSEENSDVPPSKKKPKVPSRNYTYGLLAPIEGVEVALEQMRRGHDYRNGWAEAEIYRRDKTRKILHKHHPELAEMYERFTKANDEKEALRKIIKASNGRKRRHDVDPALLARVKELRAIASKIWNDEYKPNREAVWKAHDKLGQESRMTPELDALQIEYKMMKKAACVEADASGATNDVVNLAMRRIHKAPRSPKVREWNETGNIGCRPRVQVEVPAFMKGKSNWATWAKITDVSGSRAILWVRVDSDRSRKPVWTKFPMVLHRPLPDYAQVTSILIHREKIGTNFRWSATINVRSHTGFVCRHRFAAGGTLTVTTRMKSTEDGLRVCSWIGDDGEKGELVIPEHEICERWDKVKHIKATASSNFNVAADCLDAWLKGEPIPEDVLRWNEFISHRCRVEKKDHLKVEKAAWNGIVQNWNPSPAPQWLKDATDTLSQWQSAAKLRDLVTQWSSSRFDGDEEIFTAMNAWRIRDRHLYDWWANKSDKASSWRDHLFRNFCCDMRRKYARLVLVDSGEEAAYKKTADEEADKGKNVRSLLKIASLGRLKLLLKEYFVDTSELQATNNASAVA